MKITKEQLKDIVVRTLKTLLVVALTAFVTAWVSTDMTNVEAALISAGTTAGTFILNIVIKLVTNFIDDWKLTPDELIDIFGEGEEIE